MMEDEDEIPEIEQRPDRGWRSIGEVLEGMLKPGQPGCYVPPDVLRQWGM